MIVSIVSTNLENDYSLLDLSPQSALHNMAMLLSHGHLLPLKLRLTVVAALGQVLPM